MWALFSFLAAVSFASMFLIVRAVSATSVTVNLFFIFLVAAALYGMHVIYTKQSFHLAWNSFFLLCAAALLSYIGNYFQFRAVSEGPNPGYVTAIVGSQSVLLLIAGYFFLNVGVTAQQLSGVILCTIGVALISLK